MVGPSRAAGLRCYGRALGEAFQLPTICRTPTPHPRDRRRRRDDARGDGVEAALAPRHPSGTRQARLEHLAGIGRDDVNDDIDLLRRTFRDLPACRVGTVRPDGGPYVAVRWFIWLDDEVWVSTRQGDSTWEHLIRDPRVSIVIDRGATGSSWRESGSKVSPRCFPAEHPRPSGAHVRLA